MGKFNDRDYKYMGFVYTEGYGKWANYIQRLIVDLDILIRPWWVPRWVLNATYKTHGFGMYRWQWKLTMWWMNYCNQYILRYPLHISDIKEKYATLRIYVSTTEQLNLYIDGVVRKCDYICDECGCNIKKPYGEGW
ncbi:hypothetical protein, partial [Romboutsia sp.]|uniref:hypothetical protein n=1 Tax=Romboutsia sp. TaxID=1965302 RepID=UPI003F3083ED